MKFFKYIFLTLMLLLGSISVSQATHVAGSDIQFRCLGKDTYEITLKIYRDCSGIPLSAPATITLNTVGCNPNKSATVNLPRISITPVRFMCGGQKNICEGGSFPFGMEEHTFKATVRLQDIFPGGLDPNCCKIGIGYAMCCRNGSITNGPANANFYVDAELDRCVTPCNSSPQITNPPVVVVCNGQPFWFNNGAVDTVDYDSLSYEMADPLQNPGSPIPFAGSFTRERPLQFLGFPNQSLPFPAGFHLTSTGDLGFTSTAIQQPVLAITIREWRRINGQMVEIGRTRRDVQMYTYQCPPNNPPVLRVNGSTTGPFSFTVCAGTTLCINITATDRDSALPLGPDTTKLSWNRGIPQGTFTTTNSPIKLIREDEGVFCWTPTDNYVSNLPYYFTVKAEDDNCPVPATTTRAIGIRVKARPLGNIVKTNKGCSKYGFDVNVTNQNKLTQTPAYQWTIPNNGNGVFNAVNAVTYNTKQVISHQFPAGGTYVVRLRLEADGCPNFIFDTVVVDTPVTTKLPADTFICFRDTFVISSETFGGVKPYKYIWSTGDTLSTITKSPLTTTQYILTVFDSFLCITKDTFILTVKPLPLPNLGLDKRICDYDSVQFTPGEYISYLWNTGKTTPSITVKDSAWYSVLVTDSFNCKNSDTVNLFVNRKPNPDAGRNDTICINNSTKLRGVGGDTYEWTIKNTLSVLSDKDTLMVFGSQPGTTTYNLKVTTTYKGVTCENNDEVVVNVQPLPTITFANKNLKFCYTDQWLNPDFKVNANPKGGYWTISDAAKQQCLDTNITSPNYGFIKLSCLGVGSHVLTYNYKSRFGCFNKDSVTVIVLPLPTVWAGPDTIVCANIGPINIIPYPNFGVGSEWNMPDSILNYVPLFRRHTFFPDKAKPLQTYVMIYKFKDNEGCENQDTALYTVNPIPVVDAGYISPLCINNPAFDLTTRLGAKPIGGSWLESANGTFDPKSRGVGDWVYTYSYTNEYNCNVKDTTLIKVNPIPTIKLSLSDTAVCETDPDVIINAIPRGTTSKYFVNDNQVLFPTIDPSNILTVIEGRNKVAYYYTNPLTGCSNADSTYFRLAKKPVVDILNTEPQCEGRPYNLAGTKNTKTFSVKWETFNDGNFDTATKLTPTYYPGFNETRNGSFRVKLTGYGDYVCPNSAVEKSIPIDKTPTGDFISERQGCEPFAVEFLGEFFNADSIIWNLGDSTKAYFNNPVHTYQKYGTYDISVYLKSGRGCDTTISKPLWITVHPTPTAYFEPDKNKTTVALPRFTFINKSTLRGVPITKDTVYYAWDFGDVSTDNDTSSAKSPTYTYEANIGEYIVYLLVETDKGCTAEHIDTVRIDPDITVFAPTAFRPQSEEEQNQRFYIVVDGQMTFNLDIFNRWGELVYTSDDPLEGWDGKYQSIECQQDVYAWVLTVTSYSGEVYRYNGTVTLIR